MKILLPLMLALGIPALLAYPVDSHHWNHRTIVYFAPQLDDQVDQFLLQAAMHECQLEDRQIHLMVLTPKGIVHPHDLVLAQDTEALMDRYQLDEAQHNAVLIGKDGGIKHRWQGATDWQKVAGWVDDMPMRKVEMAQRGDPCAI
ncbi:DUF4174 domain-containing protein [Ferrimonas marina]|uniref:DUF4174 domain-containing protein n=1 Tax=Ferrimonas marina TaxID=299255 RepID=A0A1M5MHC3_9GAMM|nr:DUF4174 domain-containing protein [Ferrimonas marina]SHG76339.1 protein of unknown function [Ferrimonas marina]